MAKRVKTSGGRKSKQRMVKADHKTTCCNAYTSCDEQGTEYCKGCYEPVIRLAGILQVWGESAVVPATQTS
jgi:hypothetical protein